MNEALLSRVKDRLGDEATAPDGEQAALEARLLDYIKTVSDRICLRTGAPLLPQAFESIVVDAAVKMYRRFCYEGISSENDGGVSASFVEDVLNEYAADFEAYRRRERRVRFL